MSREILPIYRNNTIDKTLKEDGVVVDLSPVTRMTLEINGTIIDSDVTSYGSGNAFDWSQGSGTVIFDVNTHVSTPSTYDARLVVYDASNTRGIDWGTFEVKATKVTSGA